MAASDKHFLYGVLKAIKNFLSLKKNENINYFDFLLSFYLKIEDVNSYAKDHLTEKILKDFEENIFDSYMLDDSLTQNKKSNDEVFRTYNEKLDKILSSIEKEEFNNNIIIIGDISSLEDEKSDYKTINSNKKKEFYSKTIDYNNSECDCNLCSCLSCCKFF